MSLIALSHRIATDQHLLAKLHRDTEQTLSELGLRLGPDELEALSAYLSTHKSVSSSSSALDIDVLGTPWLPG